MTTFCSLISQVPQVIPPNVYTALRFDGESTDLADWHSVRDLNDPASALIVPKRTGVAMLAALVFWADSDATQMLHRFTRDPYDPEKIDSTCTNDRPGTPGAEFHSFAWPMTLRAGQPVAVMVGHNASTPVAITLAEFKAVMW